ncbi:hypothetical protein LO80_07335 [Candidatus Francisella endociliophora]|uniref:Phage tail collar domain-containing protein n=1 Tax=Candidatus Francisella endociliophora TaxID=653937 RepID=A0A097EQF3_9GAMM|nr:hypothetical protein LO80_07335 [Francisella sp. FSC1006]
MGGNIGLAFSEESDRTEADIDRWQSMFISTPEDGYRYTVGDLKAKGDAWESNDEAFNILIPDSKELNTFVNNTDNNIYYLSKLVEGTPGSAAAKTGGLVKQVSDISDEVSGYDERIKTTEKEASDAKSSANTASTSATAAATSASEAKEKAEAAAGAVASKVDVAGVNSIINTQVSSGGSIYTAIGDAAKEGGAIATDISSQIEAKEGPIYDSIVSGSSIAIDDSLKEGGSIYDSVTSSDGAIAKAIEAQVSSGTGAIAESIKNSITKATAKDGAISEAIKTQVTSGTGDISAAINTAADNQITSALASSGSIITAINENIGKAAEPNGAIAKDIEDQVTKKEGPVYNSIVSGSSIAVNDAIAPSGSIITALADSGSTLNQNLANRYTLKSDFEELNTTVTDSDNGLPSKAPLSALKDYTKTSDLNTYLANSGSSVINTQIQNSVKQDGDIYKAILSENGVIAEAMQNQIVSGSGVFAEAISSGSSVAITNALSSSGGSIYESIVDKDGDLSRAIVENITTADSNISSVVNDLINTNIQTGTGSGIVTEAANVAINKAITEQSGVIRNAISSGSSIAVTDALAPSGSIISALTNSGSTLNQNLANRYTLKTDFEVLDNTVMDSGSGLVTKVDESDVEQLITEAISAPSELDQAGDSNIQGLIYKAVADAQGDLAKAIQTNIEDSQSGAVAKAVDTKIQNATQNDGGIIKTELDTKAPKADFETLQTKINDGSTGLDSKVATATLQENYTPTVGLGAVVTETMSSGSGLAIVTSEAEKVSEKAVTDAIAGDGTITEAIKTDGTEIANAVDYRVVTNSAVPIGTVVMWVSNTIPDGWLVMDGQDIDSNKYPKLHSMFRDGRTPDFRGLFVRGAGTNSKYENAKGSSVLATQDDRTARPSNAFKTNSAGSHHHEHDQKYIDRMGTDEDYRGGSGLKTLPYNGGHISMKLDADSSEAMRVYSKTDTDETKNAGAHTHTIDSGGDTETRPYNVSVYYIIKAK